MSPLLSGMVLGLAGSLHCAGMCGPVLLVLTHGARSGARGIAVYHTARISTYVLIGLPAGYAGRIAIDAGLGRIAAVIAGALLLAAAAVGASRSPGSISRLWSSAIIRVGGRAAALTQRRRVVGWALAGSVNGLLPCGLIYGAAVIAGAFGSIPRSALFMAGFGLGTLPALLTIRLAAGAAPHGVRQALGFARPVVLILAGLLLIWRGTMAERPGVHDHQNTSPAAGASQLHP